MRRWKKSLHTYKKESSAEYWATPIVVVPKPNETIRLCGDVKMTIHPVFKVDQYPLLKLEDLQLWVKVSFLDLQQAYLQMELEEE